MCLRVFWSLQLVDIAVWVVISGATRSRVPFFVSPLTAHRMQPNTSRQLEATFEQRNYQMKFRWKFGKIETTRRWKTLPAEHTSQRPTLHEKWGRSRIFLCNARCYSFFCANSVRRAVGTSYTERITMQRGAGRRSCQSTVARCYMQRSGHPRWRGATSENRSCHAMGWWKRTLQKQTTPLCSCGSDLPHLRLAEPPNCRPRRINRRISTCQNIELQLKNSSNEFHYVLFV
jgi:hypothetical protein